MSSTYYLCESLIAWLVISMHSTENQQFYFWLILHMCPNNCNFLCITSCRFLFGCKVPHRLILFAWSFCDISFQMPVSAFQNPLSVSMFYTDSSVCRLVDYFSITFPWYCLHMFQLKIAWLKSCWCVLKIAAVLLSSVTCHCLVTFVTLINCSLL